MLRQPDVNQNAHPDATTTTPPGLDARRHRIIALHFFGVEPPRSRRRDGTIAAAIVADLDQRRSQRSPPRAGTEAQPLGLDVQADSAPGLLRDFPPPPICGVNT